MLHTLIDISDHICLFAPLHLLQSTSLLWYVCVLKWARVCNLTIQDTGSLLVSVASFVKYDELLVIARQLSQWMVHLQVEKACNALL